MIDKHDDREAYIRFTEFTFSASMINCKLNILPNSDSALEDLARTN